MCNEQNNCAKLCTQVISYTCVRWHFQIFLKFFKSIISHQHGNTHVCFIQLGSGTTKLMTLGQVVCEIHGHVHHAASVTEQPRKEADLPSAATRFCKAPPYGWAVPTPSTVLAGMGTGRRHRAGRRVRWQSPEESWKMPHTPQQWLLAWKKLPRTLYPSIAEQMKAPPLFSALTYTMCYPLPAANLASSTLISPRVSPFSPLQSSFLPPQPPDLPQAPAPPQTTEEDWEQ